MGKILYIILIPLEIYWAYNVLTEKNKRVDLGQASMTSPKENSVGFNMKLGYALIDIRTPLEFLNYENDN